MKTILKMIGNVTLAMVLMFLIAACGDVVGPAEPTATSRYETVPYGGDYGGSVSSNNKLVYYAYDDTNNYYLFLLGHVNSVPLTYRTAMRYNGQSPITIGYSCADITGTSISKSVKETNTHAITNSSTFNWSVTAEAGLKKGLFSAGVSATVGGSNSWDETNTRSVTDSITTVTSWANEETDFYETTIGNNGESPGKYRFSLFATTDVYYVLITNRSKTQVTDAYTAVCTRPQSISWGIDYEPDMNGSFAKTASGDLLTIPAIVLSQLPNPIISLDKSLIPLPEEQIKDLKTFHTETRTNNLEHVNSSTQISRDETISPGLNTELLKRVGYNRVKIDVVYAFRAEAWHLLGGDLRLQIASAGKTSELRRKDAEHNRADTWSRDNFCTVTVPIESLNSPTGEFMLLWSKTGSTEYRVGTRTISITAIE